jgi:hypothetical protein
MKKNQLFSGDKMEVLVVTSKPKMLTLCIWRQP